MRYHQIIIPLIGLLRIDKVLTKSCIKPSLSIVTTPSLSSKKDISSHNDMSERLKNVTGGELVSGSSSMANSVFNLVNNIAGAGILTLSSGMAKGSSTGFFPAMIICMIFGSISAHTFIMIGRACEITGSTTFKGLWKTSIGDSTYIVDSIIALQCFASCVIYSGILGDLSTSLLQGAGMSNKLNNRKMNIMIITSFILFPLGLIKNLSALAFTSLLGITSVLYTVIFVVVRSLDQSYALPNGKFIDMGLLQKPSFQRQSMWNFGFSSLVLASNLGLGYFAHYNSPAYYRELKDSNSKKFGKMVSIGYFILVTLYITTMLRGYKTFGDVSSGNILLNYHPDDLLSTFARIATLFSIIFGFPLVFRGTRESFIDAASSFGLKALGFPKNHSLLVAGLLLFIASISINVQDVSFVVGLSGATLGCFLIFICPVIIYTRSVGIQKGWESVEYARAKWNLPLIPFGISVGILGVIVNLKQQGML